MIFSTGIKEEMKRPGRRPGGKRWEWWSKNKSQSDLLAVWRLRRKFSKMPIHVLSLLKVRFKLKQRHMQVSAPIIDSISQINPPVPLKPPTALWLISNGYAQEGVATLHWKNENKTPQQLIVILKEPLLFKVIWLLLGCMFWRIKRTKYSHKADKMQTKQLCCLGSSF